MKKSLKTVMVATAITTAQITFFASTAQAQGIPTYDNTAVLQAIEQFKRMKEQLDTARQQLSEAQRLHDSMSGTRGLGDLLRNNDLREFLPEDMAAIYDSTNRGGLEGIQGGIDEVLRNERISTSNPHEAQQSVLQREREMAAANKAMGQKAYEGAQKRLDQVEQLMNEISDTQDQKAISELQARLSGEQAAIQNEVQKIALVEQLQIAESKLIEQQKDEAVRLEFDSSKTGMPGIL